VAKKKKKLIFQAVELINREEKGARFRWEKEKKDQCRSKVQGRKERIHGEQRRCAHTSPGAGEKLPASGGKRRLPNAEKEILKAKVFLGATQVFTQRRERGVRRGNSGGFSKTLQLLKPAPKGLV